METYLVGGAVRDALLGRPILERDWLVVGADRDLMLAAGFKQVGNFFPVFLHPQTGEEYALARRERKSGVGHQAFEFVPTTSVAEDLLRRDLSINAMAMDPSGRIIDPHGGRQDLSARQLRHVSPAFAEDPLRILRVARFTAQLAPFGFNVADATIELMRSMATMVDYSSLSAERVWQESQRALQSPQPLRYWQVLQQAQALQPWFAEFSTIDFNKLSMPDQLNQLDSSARWLLLLYLLSQAGANAAEFAGLHKRLKTPAIYSTMARLLPLLPRLPADWRAAELSLQLLERCDALRRPQRLHSLITCALSAAIIDNEIADKWRQLLHCLQSMPMARLTQNIPVRELPKQIRSLRLEYLQSFLAAE